MLMTDTGQQIYQRTYARPKPDGSLETWPETVARVVAGNLSLGDSRHELPGEREDLIDMMTKFEIIPGGRHLWASGVKGRQYLFNCHVSHWGPEITDHFSFTFLRLMEGGGVGANYSNRYLAQYPEIQGFQHIDSTWLGNPYSLHIVCDSTHPDYQTMKDAGLLSTEYVSDWDGCYAVEDSREGWADALTDLISTYYRPAKNRNRVFDVSRVRPRGAKLHTFGGTASGPAPLAQMLHEVTDVMNARIGAKLDGIGAMEIDHAIATCVVSGGVRRSARMAIMRWDDPQIFEFLSAKQTSGKHWTTNISVEVDNDFFRLQDQLTGEVNDADLNNSYNAHTVMAAIAEGMLNNGEPGIWNSELSNVGEPNPVVATNPCGEIALEAWENCNLGHVNLAAFVGDSGDVDYDRMKQAHILMTRFLMRATNGDVNDSKQAATLARNRRIGVGHLGVASYLAMKGLRYSEAGDRASFLLLLQRMSNSVDEAAAVYAHDLRIPVPVKKRTVAPTGTIAKLVGVSEGIHPIFAKYFLRRIRFSDVDAAQREQVEDYRTRGYHVEPCQYAANTTVVTIPTQDILMQNVTDRYGVEFAESVVQSVAELSAADMLKMQEVYQTYWADNAVSYTVNFNPSDMTVEGIAAVLREYGPTLKGTTFFPELSHAQPPYERITRADFELYSYLAEVGDGTDESCASGACPVR